ncbi:MAG: Na-K-Cl cotransporter, partial [Candidatus Omnitrophota bacterium]
FAESVIALYPFLSYKLVAVCTLVCISVISYISANIALKLQFIILILVISSLVSFFLGKPIATSVESSILSIPHVQPFWVVFAVFFPAVTGIEAGLAMSGDLKNPAKSLPLGTLGAIIASYAVYMSIPIFLNKVIPDQRVLLVNSFIIKDVAAWGGLIILGVWGASLSSALGGLLGAPRTLQALARDKVLPSIIGKGFGKGGDPRIAIVISFFVAFTGILLGNLNTIAPVLAMFFLTAYGLLNMSAAFEGLIGSPSWRPKFRIHWGFSFAGACCCFAVMFMINAGATFIAIFVSCCVYIIIKKRRINTSWSDMRYGILMLVLYYIIHRLEDRKPDERTWRPNILVLSGPPKARWHLIELADAIACKRGLLTVSTIVTDEVSMHERIENIRDSLRRYMKENGVRALMNVHSAPDMLGGAQEMIRAYGFGSVSPNTIILGETEKRENFIQYARLISLAHRQKRNLLIVRNSEIQVKPHEKLRMEILWRGKQKNAGLMLALAYLITMSSKWEKTNLILKTIIQDPSKKEETLKNVSAFIKGQRIDAQASVIVNDKNEDVFNVIKDSVTDANLVFLGLRPPADDESPEEYSRYYVDLLNKTEHFPSTILSLASEDIAFNRIFSHQQQ